jgi:hypothetical protein
MTLSLYWGSERSTYHATCVKKVYRYLKQKCGEADYEKKLVADRITDALGYNTKTKTWYLCEIKVNFTDLQKAAYQIHDTAFRFKRNHKAATVIPVIAFPLRLQKELVKFDNWDSLRNLCRTTGVAIWVIGQSTVRETMSPKTKVVKPKNATTKAVKTKRPKTKTSKTKATRTKTAKTKPRSVKSSKVKQSKVKKTVHKISKTTSSKSKAVRSKSRGST